MVGLELPSIVLSFDSNVFPLETIKRALYRFADRCSFDIHQIGTEISVRAHLSAGATDQHIGDLANKIRNEVLDQDLRDTISKETANIRALILANAFSNSKLIKI